MHRSRPGIGMDSPRRAGVPARLSDVSETRHSKALDTQRALRSRSLPGQRAWFRLLAAQSPSAPAPLLHPVPVPLGSRPEHKLGSLHYPTLLLSREVAFQSRSTQLPFQVTQNPLFEGLLHHGRLHSLGLQHRQERWSEPLDQVLRRFDSQELVFGFLKRACQNIAC